MQIVIYRLCCLLKQSKIATKSKWPFVIQLGRVYTRAVFRNFEKKVFNSSAYDIEADPELGEHWYRVCHTNRTENISWGQHKFKVKADKVNEAYSCECREWEHTGNVHKTNFKRKIQDIRKVMPFNELNAVVVAGLLCVHLLRAFVEVHVQKLSCKYILNRYTRFSRSEVNFDMNDKLLTGEDGFTQSYRTKTLIPKAMKAVRSGSMSDAAHKRLVEILENATKELDNIPQDIGASARNGPGQSRAEVKTC